MLTYLVAIGTVALIYALLTMGLNLQYGFTGMVNFGHVAFFAIGAYASALLSMGGMPVAVSIAAGAALAAIAGAPISLLALRLSDDYLAIVTLGFSESMRIVIQQESWLTGGAQGMPGIARLFGDLGGAASGLSTLLCLVACVAGASLLLVRIIRSPYGRLIRSIRDDEVAAQALGKDANGRKVEVFMFGAGLAGLAGGFYAHFMSFLSADQFVPLVTFYVWIAMIIGGVGRLAGAVVGSVILVGFLEGSRFARDLLPGVDEVQMASVRVGVIGLALILFTIFRPQGLMGGKVVR